MRKVLNFGASIYRVVGIDFSDAVFEPGTTEIHVQWQPRLNTLLEELRKAPSVMRLSFIADTEDAALVERRMEAIKGQLTKDAASGASSNMYYPEAFPAFAISAGWRIAPAKTCFHFVVFCFTSC